MTTNTIENRARSHEEAVQQFFEALQNEIRKPHFGGPAKEVVANLLLRAQEAGIYQPPKELQP